MIDLKNKNNIIDVQINQNQVTWPLYGPGQGVVVQESNVVNEWEAIGG